MQALKRLEKTQRAYSSSSSSSWEIISKQVEQNKILSSCIAGLSQFQHVTSLTLSVVEQFGQLPSFSNQLLSSADDNSL
jgi:hypothetical protein